MWQEFTEVPGTLPKIDRISKSRPQIVNKIFSVNSIASKPCLCLVVFPHGGNPVVFSKVSNLGALTIPISLNTYETSMTAHLPP